MTQIRFPVHNTQHQNIEKNICAPCLVNLFKMFFLNDTQHASDGGDVHFHFNEGQNFWAFHVSIWELFLSIYLRVTVSECFMLPLENVSFPDKKGLRWKKRRPWTKCAATCADFMHSFEITATWWNCQPQRLGWRSIRWLRNPPPRKGWLKADK